MVSRGDSLWRIAARHLGPGATDAEVAAEWPRWWHANRKAVGPDPDLLLPGTRLRPPQLRLDGYGSGTGRGGPQRHADQRHADQRHADRTRHDAPHANAHTQRNDTHETKELR